MCGISGYLSQIQNISGELFYNAHSTMSHRGPDDEGFICLESNQILHLAGQRSHLQFKETSHQINKFNSTLFLGHHRLSILDLTTAGHQPYQYKNLTMTYNGEVYNYLEIRNELKNLGYNFESESDTEVVLKAFAEWGKECFSKFNGMWALAIYDFNKKTLTLSRDRFGKKPLLYNHSNGNLHFASEIQYFKKILNLTISPVSSYLYLEKNIHQESEHTFYNEVSNLLPGHTLEFSAKENSLKFYKFWDFPKQKDNYNLESALTEFSNLFTDSIALRLRSNVPIGCMLSGGLDSTLIASYVAKQMPHQKIETFSAIYDENQFSEEIFILETLKKYPSLSPHFVKISATDFINDHNDFIQSQPTPLRSLAIYAQYKLYKEVKINSNVTVLLNGQGSDECWGGYQNHYTSFLLGQLLAGNINTFFDELELLSKKRNIHKNTIIKSILIGLANRCTPKNLKKISREHTTHSHWDIHRINEGAFNLREKLIENFKYSALKEYLFHEDTNSMLFSKESRLPFLDYRLVNLAFSLNDSFKINNFENKFLVRQFAFDKIPDNILNRKDKMGFTTPQENWQRNALKNMMMERITKDPMNLTLDTSHFKNSALDYFNGKNNDWGMAWRLFSYYSWCQNQTK